MNTNKLIGSILLSVAACIWGGTFVAVKVIVGEIHPIQLVWLRYFVAIIFLIAFSLIRREHWHVKVKDLKWFALIGLTGYAVSLVAQETGTWFSSAQTGAVVTSATPTFMAIFAWWILKEKLNHMKIISVIMATLGVLMIVGIHLTGKHILTGVVLWIVAALTWSLMSVLIQKVSDYSALQITIISTIIAMLFLTPFVLRDASALESVNFFSPKVIICLFYVGALSTAAAFVMWNKGLTMVNPSVSGLFYLLQPIVGTLLGWLLLGEDISWGFVAGSIMILASVWVSIKFA
ncbi:DMT family transporter [Companilactobacillus halodurans]|uniref:DMT family transporter n=1 Tax=Companilactobacillus halodurans TaxID=2584183 RepID=A0A5P0ZU79_9LACO|nr:DMT family transporter [Companilactobacillus halodurans]MQS76283.1 DMT family transporter [Companilactobacillus halodurans]MQS96587.1 DMT family transporter [Companilactobacillus halodurans]